MPSFCLKGNAFAIALNLSVGLASLVARAQPSDEELQSAREQFAHAEEDEDAGRWRDALDKLRSVASRKQTAGVRYHIALCEEHLGQLASALEDYLAANAEAHAENAQDVLKLVGTRLTELGPRVPRLTISVVPDVAEATLTLDGKALSREIAATPMAVDPGPHRIEVTAPDREPATTQITMREHEVTVLEMKLAAVAAPSPLPVAAPVVAVPQLPPKNTGRAEHALTLAYTLGAVALLGGGVGAYVAAGEARASGETSCALLVSESASACSPQRTAVRAWDWVAAGAWAAGAAATTLAVIAWTRPSHPAPAGTTMRLGLGLRSAVVAGEF
jgi:hypothetical protein